MYFLASPALAWHEAGHRLTAEIAFDLLGETDQQQFAALLRHDLNLIQVLKGNLLVWRDATASDSQKAMALCWILHLTGDVHEPLHNVALFSKKYFAEGDRGGNLITVKRDGGTTNLHAVWDGLANYLDDVSAEEDTREILANDVADINAIDDWARDGQQMSKDFAYSEEVRSQLLGQPPRRRNPQITLSAEYIAVAEKIARPHVIIAGHRIAVLLTN